MKTVAEVKKILREELPLGVDSLIPYDWLAKHWNDLDGVKFTIEISSGKTSHSMTFNSSASSKSMRDAIKSVVREK